MEVLQRKTESEAEMELRIVLLPEVRTPPFILQTYKDTSVTLYQVKNAQYCPYGL